MCALACVIPGAALDDGRTLTKPHLQEPNTEAVMSTSITTTIRIQHGVLDPENRILHDVYKPLGRCVEGQHPRLRA